MVVIVYISINPECIFFFFFNLFITYVLNVEV